MTNNLRKTEEKKEDNTNEKKINLKKILDKNLKIAKNDNITLTHKNELDFKNIPIIEDVVEEMKQMFSFL